MRLWLKRGSCLLELVIIFLIRLLFLAAIVCLLLVTLTYTTHPPPLPSPSRTHWNRSRRKTSLDSLAKRRKWAITSDTKQVACVASISVGFRSKKRPRNVIFGTRAIFRAVFDSRSSFFAPKPHGNACYAGYDFSKWRASSYATKQVNFASSSFCFYRAAREGNAQSRNESRLC